MLVAGKGSIIIHQVPSTSWVRVKTHLWQQIYTSSQQISSCKILCSMIHGQKLLNHMVGTC